MGATRKTRTPFLFSSFLPLGWTNWLNSILAKSDWILPLPSQFITEKIGSISCHPLPIERDELGVISPFKIQLIKISLTHKYHEFDLGWVEVWVQLDSMWAYLISYSWNFIEPIFRFGLHEPTRLKLGNTVSLVRARFGCMKIPCMPGNLRCLISTSKEHFFFFFWISLVSDTVTTD